MAINKALTASRGPTAGFDGLTGGELEIALGTRSRFGSGAHVSMFYICSI